MSDGTAHPVAPDVPDYVIEALEPRDPEELRAVAAYARKLADYVELQRERDRQARQRDDRLDEGLQQKFEEQEYSTDPDDYEGVPDNAYVTIKEPKPGNRYFYWQWRSGSNSWENEYIGPVDGKAT